MIDPKLTSLEIYGIAVKSEIDAINAYQKIAKKVENQDLNKKLQFLEGEEKKHRKLLENRYRLEFPDTKLMLPKDGLAPKLNIALEEDTPLARLFELSMEAEKASEDFYSEAAKRAQDQTGKNMLFYLSGMERGHYYLLKSEYDLMQQFDKFESYKKFSLEHLGP
ncbi:MAG: ferritin family protein [bacterium]|nr:ferritin family protein [candidate division WOR-3 bacterium]MDH5682856.1 ferritin family protein [candidate division WOR-3 bacterium]